MGDKWRQSIFWGQGKEYTPSWGLLPRSDLTINPYRQKLQYELSTRVMPSISRKVRIIGGDVVPGLGIVHRTFPSSHPFPSTVSPQYNFYRAHTPKPTEHFSRVIGTCPRSSRTITRAIYPSDHRQKLNRAWSSSPGFCS